MLKHIVVPTDFSKAAEAAFGFALELAAVCGARVTLLHVVFGEKITEELLGLDALEYLARTMDAPGQATYVPGDYVARLREAAERQLEDAVAQAAREGARAKVAVATAVAEGRPSAEIINFAHVQGANLIVMGTQGRSALGRAFLGSVADHVIRQADCPVTVVRK
jgi:nucleotide-binding universal stress UspA family protein